MTDIVAQNHGPHPVNVGMVDDFIEGDGLIIPVHPEFAFSDGNIEIQSSDFLFWLHEFQLNKFQLLAKKIGEFRKQAAAIGTTGPRHRIKIKVSDQSTDLVNTFRIIYTSIVPSIPPFSPDWTAFVSAIRIANRYDYPDLRVFAIGELCNLALPTIQRIRLADELAIPEWEPIALAELCHRTTPVSQYEAEILGASRVVEISRRREEEQRRRFRESRHIEYFSMVFGPNPWILMPLALWMFYAMLTGIANYTIKLTFVVAEEVGIAVRFLGLILNKIITVEY
ncbi:unnamed protein product [Rhizoctonia solani]|uniref:BTB domain-containing protein n=1 Tax=Rhizoctonia solani TaxID=456999 RepID=A0A8H2W5S8_9AGAM|nr:unnamed protein product [Rhizoctonia solani]